jgi:hypothetical protein
MLEATLSIKSSTGVRERGGSALEVVRAVEEVACLFIVLYGLLHAGPTSSTVCAYSCSACV